MKRKIVALAVSLAVLFGTVVQTEAGTAARGKDTVGKMGTGIGGEKICLNTAKKVSEKVVAVSLGDWHSGAIMEDGSLYVWGGIVKAG